jgi:hypothetical protein
MYFNSEAFTRALFLCAALIFLAGMACCVIVWWLWTYVFSHISIGWN